MSQPRFPPAPDLHGELLLDVFTHRSLRQEDGSGDNERYAELGEKVLEAAVTHCIFLRFPHHSRDEIAEERARLLSDENYAQWMTFYRFRDKLRHNRQASGEVNSPEGTRQLFHAYVGGAYLQTNGPSVVNSWVYRLVVPPGERSKLEAKMMPSHPPPPPPQPNYPYPMAPPPPPSPHIDQYMLPRSRTSSFSSIKNVSMSIDDPLDGSQYYGSPVGKPVYLPRFNEIATQRRMNVQYPAEQLGLQHAPRWSVKCVVDGTEYGQGTATTKQLAKEEAVKQAFVALKFPTPGT